MVQQMRLGFQRIRVRTAVVGALTLCAFGATLVPVGSVPVAAAASVDTVPVTVLDGPGTAEGARPTVDVRVGNSETVPVLLDTGSSGLHLFDTAVATGPGSGVRLTTQSADITYAGGHRFTGVVGDAVVTIGSFSTKQAVPFADVEQAFCIAGMPTCPASGGIPGFERSGIDGILGIGTQSSGGGLVSPILGMGGAMGKKWSLHLSGNSGALVLGARLPARRSSTLIQMTSAGTSAGKPLWADSRLPLCVAVGTDDECVPGLFDSGTYTMQISGPELARAPVVPGTEHVVPGTPVTVGVVGGATPFWTFAAGQTKSQDLLTVKPGDRPFVNTGVQAFYRFTITYDDASGQIRLS